MQNLQDFISFHDSFDFINKYKDQEIFIITDTNLEQLYFKKIFKHFPYLAIGPGEEYKRLFTVENIIEYMLRLGFSRSCKVIGFGGGVVCDISGLVASLYKRGVDLMLVPSTLLCMVDASLGGKNGVNSEHFKNQFGSFKQPLKVNYDITLFKTLPQEEVVNGIAEMLKHGLISSKEYFDEVIDYFSNHKVLDNPEKLKSLIYQSLQIKFSFVNNDVEDKGIRRILNFGHTLGHIIEKVNSYPHGVSVLWGMQKAITISKKLGLLPEEIFNSITKNLNLFNDILEESLSWEVIFPAIINDKKVEDKILNLILIEDYGKPLIKEVAFDDLEKIIDND